MVFISQSRLWISKKPCFFVNDNIVLEVNFVLVSDFYQIPIGLSNAFIFNASKSFLKFKRSNRPKSILYQKIIPYVFGQILQPIYINFNNTILNICANKLIVKPS